MLTLAVMVMVKVRGMVRVRVRWGPGFPVRARVYG